MIVELLTISVVSLCVLVAFFRLTEWRPWLMETNARKWIVVGMFISSAVSAISFILFLTLSVGDKM